MGDVRVPVGETLVIEPGVEIQFAGQYFMRILGSFSAEGLPGDSITFTSQSGIPNWKGLKLDSLDAGSDTARFSFCRITNMKNNGIFIYNTNAVKFEHTRIFDNLDMYIGAMYCAVTNPLISHCKFENNDSNSGSEGAAMYIWDASPYIEFTDFVGNQSPWTAGAIALYRSDITPEPQFISCNFINNFTSGSGGAVVSHSNCLPYYENCQFIGNSSGYDGGAIWDGYTLVGTTQYVNCLFEGNHCEDKGGVAYFVDTQSSFTNCDFRDNYTQYNSGGAIHAYDEAYVGIEGCSFQGNVSGGQGGALYINDYTTLNINRSSFIGNQSGMGGAMVLTYYVDASITNSIFTNNESVSNGGAMRLVQYSNPEIINCVIANNHTESDGGALSLYWESNPELTNSIIWGNTADGEGDILHTQDYIWHSCSATFDHCTVENGDLGFYLGETGSASCYECLEENPQFFEPSTSSGNSLDAYEALWKVSTDSPCIDAGTGSAAELGLGDQDFEGEARFQGTALDHGAYEGGIYVQPYEPLIDLNDDGIITTSDLLVFLGSFGCVGEDCIGDLNGDGLVNTFDLLIFLSLFG
jgi:hypothetical protein